jgi:hypothetical protein
MPIRRPKGYCPSCDAQVEWYSDGVGAPGHPWRCGNCFQGASEEQLQRFESVYRKLEEHDNERQQILDDALRG